MKQKHYAFVDHFFEQVIMLNSFIAVKIVEHLFQNYHKYYKLIQKMQTICFHVKPLPTPIHSRARDTLVRRRWLLYAKACSLSCLILCQLLLAVYKNCYP